MLVHLVLMELPEKMESPELPAMFPDPLDLQDLPGSSENLVNLVLTDQLGQLDPQEQLDQSANLDTLERQDPTVNLELMVPQVSADLTEKLVLPVPLELKVKLGLLAKLVTQDL